MTNSAALSLSAMTSQYFIGGMMPELANPVQAPGRSSRFGHGEIRVLNNDGSIESVIAV
jgi:hypothetical protein